MPMTLCPTHLLDHPEGCPWCVVDSLTHSGNGEVIRNWMKAHGKAMDQLEATEEKLRLAQIENHQLKQKLDKADQDVQALGNLSVNLRVENDELTRHCNENNVSILNWMQSHGMVMYKLEETEEKLKLVAMDTELAYRAGYRDGSTAVNTVGPDALDHVEMHLKKWREEI